MIAFNKFKYSIRNAEYLWLKVTFSLGNTDLTRFKSDNFWWSFRKLKKWLIPEIHIIWRTIIFPCILESTKRKWGCCKGVKYEKAKDYCCLGRELMSRKSTQRCCVNAISQRTFYNKKGFQLHSISESLLLSHKLWLIIEG